MSSAMVGGVAMASAYLLGSISPSYLAFRVLQGGDIRDVGSGNAGATNVLRSAGRRPAIAVLLADLLKGALPVIVARELGLGLSAVAGVAFAAVAGHVFSIFMRFRGGKGVATAAGALGALDPLALAIAAALFVGVVALTRYVSVGSLVATLTFPFLAAALSRVRHGAGEPMPVELLAAATGIGLLVLFKHRSNLANLMEGRERRLGERSGLRGAPVRRDPTKADRTEEEIR